MKIMHVLIDGKRHEVAKDVQVVLEDVFNGGGPEPTDIRLWASREDHSVIVDVIEDDQVLHSAVKGPEDLYDLCLQADEPRASERPGAGPDGKRLWFVQHEHKHGSDTFLFRSAEMPTERQVVAMCHLDFDGDEDNICIWPVPVVNEV